MSKARPHVCQVTEVRAHARTHTHTYTQITEGGKTTFLVAPTDKTTYHAIVHSHIFFALSCISSITADFPSRGPS